MQYCGTFTCTTKVFAVEIINILAFLPSSSLSLEKSPPATRSSLTQLGASRKAELVSIATSKNLYQSCKVLSYMVMTSEFDPQAMILRFQERAKAVKNRGIPPVEGPDRRAFMDRAKLDYMDYAILGDAHAELVNGILTLTVDLRRENS